MNAMLLLKASLLLSAALFAARLLRRGPASVRHGLWSVTFAALLALPVLAVALPTLYVPVPAGWRIQTLPAVQPASPATFPGAGDARVTDRARGDEATTHHAESPGIRRVPPPVTPGGESRIAIRPSILTLLLATWLIGSIVATGALVLSLLRVRRLIRTAVPLDETCWRDAAAAVGARLRLRRPARLLVGSGVRTPMAGGIWRLVVFLPSSALGWSAERREIVLAHELAHLAGRDPLRHLAARLAVALYWFHPLAWIAARESSVAREQACDEAVLALGTRPSVYAQVLLDLAESLQAPAPALAALPMVERSLLEARLMAILNHDIRRATPRRVLAPALGLVLLTAVVSASQPSVGAPAGFAAHPVPNVASIVASPVATVVAAATSTSAAVARLSEGGAQVRGRDSSCWWDFADGSGFSGSISTSRVGGRTVVNQQVGTRGADRVIQQRFGDLRVCMVAEGVDEGGKDDRPSDWIRRARHVVMEARRGNVTQQLDLDRESAAVQRATWRVGGQERPFDGTVQQWRDRMLAAFDTTWELSSLRGNVSSLRGEISSIRGEESSLRGEISSLRGEVSSMRGRASSALGDESSLRGQVSSIQGHLSSLRGEISSEQGAISSLNADRYGADAAERARITTSVAKHDAAIDRLEREIRDYNAPARIAAVEKEIRALDTSGKVAAIDAEIRAFDLDGKVAAIERQIAALDVDGKTAAIEKQIAALDAERRARQLEERRDEEIKRLEAAMAAIR
jgi:beta-lactamase regulating signal transducer with metallopeptidase domain/predicted  nucleic acid-binding Zn-ribbon protein